jgi:hypothetical protein
MEVETIDLERRRDGRCSRERRSCVRGVVARSLVVAKLRWNAVEFVRGVSNPETIRGRDL